MSDTPETDGAAAIARKLEARRWELSEFKIWGSSYTRPGDAIYLLRSVSAKGDRLALELSQPNDPTEKGDTLSLFSPEGFQIAGRGFAIRKAARIEWGESSFQPQAGKAAALEAR